MLPHVLIVDNDSQTLDIMKLYLKGVARVSTVLGGMQAINFVHQNKVDIILLDIEMPVMDGHRLTKLVKSDSQLRDVPVVIFSSLVNDEMRKKGEQLGADAQLAKPEIGNLVREIDKLIISRQNQ